VDEGGIPERLEDLGERVPHREDEAGGELPQLPAGVHERRGVGEELQGRHSLEEPPLGPSDLRLARAVESVRLRRGPRHPGKELLRRLDETTLVVARQVPPLEHGEGVGSEIHDLTLSTETTVSQPSTARALGPYRLGSGDQPSTTSRGVNAGSQPVRTQRIS